MKNVLIIVGLLIGVFLIARLCSAEWAVAGRIGISAVFFFTALGHFVKADEMMEMLPAGLALRKPLIIVSGIFEVLLATAVLIEATAWWSGLAICIFLVLVTPLNIQSAIRRVDFAGHASGPRYLAIRLPLQVFLLAWTYWFTLR